MGPGLAVSLAGCTDSNIPEDAVQELPAPTLGSDDAPVTVEIFEDYGCPHCATFNERVKPSLISNYISTGKAKLEFHDYPVPVTEWSWPSAMAARSVQDRADDEAFWDFSQVLFDNQSRLGYALFRETANELSLDGAGVVADARNNMYRPVVQNDYDYGQSKGVSGTPTVFVAGQLVRPSGNTYESYYRAIAQAIEANQ
jgi:protein-disulfide isomerase